MNLLQEDFFISLRKKRNILLIVFIFCVIVLASTYFYSFTFNTLWIPLLIGIASVIFLVLFYYGAIYDKSKLLKFQKSVLTGITQEDSYTFERTDDITEHDGIRLLRLLCTFVDDGETFNRTLYFLADLPHPELIEGSVIKVKTHRNIIINIED